MYVINGRFLTMPLTGIGRFSLEICKVLQRKNISFELILPRKYQGKIKDTFGLNLVYYGRYDSHLWEQVSLLQYLRKHSNPLLICLSGIGPIFYKRKVMTIHDLSFLAHPQWFSKSYYLLYKYLTPISAKNSSLILTVSEFSKSEIVKYLHTEPNKILVIYNATNFHQIEKIDHDYQNPYGDYILGVFSLDPRKNYALLINAFQKINNDSIKLLLVGKKFSNFNNENLDQSLNDRIIFTGYVDDEELQYLYKNAKLFVYPSLYEGFGIPPLEALSYGGKVLLSDIPVFKEIFGTVVQYFRSNDVDDLAEKITFLISNNYQPEKKQINELLQKYDWNLSAEILIQNIKRL